ncbi:MAG: septation protein A [Nitrosomonas sp.]|jgi:intracellular septation protein|uniref:septation protein A n=1 Tax=Nitrosomonas sp. TaxID=42353 RepID=UPI00271B9757|nr:septation protein A [Nitrosomonas sp.]MDO8895490.1 septation protein A [Nitrosomonas sp.]MDO9469662.1 septation protein A [Nitrosomonas sp.]MDP1549352.1 septation protein A [Nitrosomonas sp.]MDP1788031.1 septation protein A [Nitrosomonas sp.]MDP1935418.1 septation protein A [Nitrosomonas sp.]
MKFLFDLFPVILFFLAFKLYDIFIATAVAIVAAIVQIGWLWFRRRQVDKMMWINLAIIVVFGGATLISQDETFIKWKPTVLYWLIATVLLLSNLVFRKNLIQTMLEKQIVVPSFVWSRLNLSWVSFFLTMGCINLYVAFSFSVDTWVTFKLFGATGLMFVFIIVQMMMIGKYLRDMPPAVVENVTVNELDILEKIESKASKER